MQEKEPTQEVAGSTSGETTDTGKLADGKKPDRKLGDEWSDWNPENGSQQAVIDEDQRVFIGFAFLCLISMILVAIFISYMIYPRLEGWHHYLASGAVVLLALVSAAVLLWFTAIVVPLLTGIRPRWRLEFVQKSLNALIPSVFRLGCFLGINRDRMGNSFIKVSNAIISRAKLNRGSGPLMILLPRCLSKETRKSVNELGERYKSLVFTVPGGELARKLIREHKPSRIIAVACERDLVSGIQDVASVVPTYAVPNCRPEGPCKNTLVDLRLIEEALILFSPGKPDLQAHE